MALLPAATLNAAANAIVVASTTYYLSLHSATPGTTGASEISGGSYARQAITFGSASGGVASSTNSQSYTNLPAEGSGCAFGGVWTAVTAGTYLGGVTLSGTITEAFSAGANASFSTGAVTCTVTG